MQPDTKTKPFALIAWLYGPMAAGALSVLITSLVIAMVLLRLAADSTDMQRPTDLAVACFRLAAGDSTDCRDLADLAGACF